MDHKHDIVGYAEIIDLAREEFGAEFPLSTVRNWEKYRRAWVAKGSPSRSGLRVRETPLPEPAAFVNGTPAWCWEEIRAWLIASKRVEEQPPSE